MQVKRRLAYNPKDRLKCTQYWETQSNELEETMKQGELANRRGIIDDLNLDTLIQKSNRKVLTL